MTLNNSSPYENIFSTAPYYAKLQIFGSLCYSWLDHIHSISLNLVPSLVALYLKEYTSILILQHLQPMSHHLNFVKSCSHSLIYLIKSLAFNYRPLTLDFFRHSESLCHLCYIYFTCHLKLQLLALSCAISSLSALPLSSPFHYLIS